MRRLAGRVLALAVVGAPCAHAQIAKGNLYGTVFDESGAVLPGASVTLTSGFGPRSTQTDSLGEFRILSLDHGSYQLRVTLPGFRTVERSLIVTAGANPTLTIELEIGGLEEALLVEAASPLVEPKKLGTMTALPHAELARLPQVRDPWDLLRTVPGILVQRVNIAGDENDQQSHFVGKGADPADTTWSIDGLQLDDMSAGGQTPTYWEYGAFDEIAITTGGNPLQVQTGGVGLNFVTKRGDYRWRGSVRGFLTHDDLQWGNVKGTDLENDPVLELPDGSFSDKANHIQQIHEYGVEIGGPIIRDELFVWATYGRQDHRKVRITQVDLKTLLDGFNAKLSWDVSEATQASVFYSNTRKTREKAAFAGFEVDETALGNQSTAYTGFLPFDINGLLKFEVNHVVNQNFFVDLKYANWDTGFALSSVDRSLTSTWDYFNGTVRGGAGFEFVVLRPLKHVTDVSGSYFTSGWGGKHELKFGFGYKQHGASTQTTYGGRDESLFAQFYAPDFATVQVLRDGRLSFESEFFHGYVGDTFTRDRLTLIAGVRFDHQSARNRGQSVPASPSFPELLPSLEYPGGGTGITWSGLSPRLGITYALDEEAKTVARLSFASYAGKLATGDVTFDNPLQVAFQAYLWDDLNGDGLPSAAEVDLDSGLLYFAGHDPADPTRLDTPNRIDPGYRAPRDYEVILGIDRELAPDLAVSAAYTWRRRTGQHDWIPRLRPDGSLFTAADYIENPPVTANGFTANTFSPDPALIGDGARLLTNRPDYHRGFHGVEVSLIKRLSNRWMSRVAFSYLDHREYLGGPGAISNPTRTIGSGSFQSGPQVHGGQVGRDTGVGGKGSRVLNAKWQLNANALYELPAGFEVSAVLFARQGFAHAISLQLPAGADISRRGRPFEALAVPELDSQRLPDFWNLDLRLAKRIRFGAEAGLTLSVELFNAFNSSIVLNRNRVATARNFDRIEELPNPRIIRLGARLSF